MSLDNWIDIDKSLLLDFNGSGSMFIDGLMLTVTSGYTWIPLYVVLLYLVVKNNEKWLSVFLIMACIVLCVLLSGGFSDIFVKDYVARLRPVNAPSMSGLVRIIRGYRVDSYGFFSSHASNTMSVAVFISLLVRSRILGTSLVLWSLANSYTRLYLGVHYPSDVIIGGIWGVIVGFSVYLLFLSLYKKISPKLHYVSSRYTKTGYNLTDIDVVMNVLMLILAYVIIKTIIIAF